MVFLKSKFKPGTLNIVSLVFTLTGIIFMLLSEYVGVFLVRIVILAFLMLISANLKMTYKYLKSKEKLNLSIIILSSLIGLYQPNLLMIIIGFLLIYLSLPQYLKIIKTKDYSDIVFLVINGISLAFAIYCFLNAKASLNTLVIVLGIALIISGCLIFYDSILKRKNYNKGHDIERYED